MSGGAERLTTQVLRTEPFQLPIIGILNIYLTKDVPVSSILLKESKYGRNVLPHRVPLLFLILVSLRLSVQMKDKSDKRPLPKSYVRVNL